MTDTRLELVKLLYYTMPFVAGETLRARLTRGDSMPLRESVRIVREIAEALSYAHEQGVVHRDIKPENVLLENGHAVVADFGVAKALANAAAGPNQSIFTVTGAGFVVGSVAYMSPEQASGDPATDHRSDIYSLGVVAYELFTGAPPFSGSAHQVITAHMAAQPEPLGIRCPGIPAAIGDLTMQLLLKSPGDRPQSAASVVEAIDAVLSSGAISDPRFSSALASRPGVSVPAESGARPLRMSLAAVAGAVALLLTVGYGAYKVAPERDPQTSRGGRPDAVRGAPVPQAVAVLPFVNTSGDIQNEHFSNGLTDELINALGQIRGLRVAARTSVFALDKKGLSASAIADTLGVATLVEGSARRSGNRLKVTAQIVSAADGTVLWSQAFNRDLADVFLVQEEIARAVVAALNVRLTESQRASLGGRETRDMEAYDLYLRGRFAWNKRSREGVENAVGFFQSAIQHDSGFALPFAGLAEAYVVMSNYGYMPFSEALNQAEIAANRALALNSSLPEAHSSKGFVLVSRGKFVDSEKSLRKAIELNPSYPLAHHYYSLLLTIAGRLDEASAQNRATLSLDPLSVPANGHQGVLLLGRKNYPQARVELQKAVRLSAENAIIPYFLGALEAAEGRYSDALPLLQRAHRDAPGFPNVKGALALTYARTGRRSEADSILREIRTEVADDRTRIQLALAEAINGHVDRAYVTLATGAKWDVPTLILLRTDPLLTAFRADTRYPLLLAGIGLRP
ncbi:MAG TPA: protein kinase [Gemmatimonadaceae bacterium]|nr:protein kinase [Gemmatimonadaceae bacterium]